MHSAHGFGQLQRRVESKAGAELFLQEPGTQRRFRAYDGLGKMFG